MHNVVATTTSGRIEGDDLGGSLRFLGIPYGADTAGPNRFRPPQPVATWTGIRPAHELGAMAMQPVREGARSEMLGTGMSEDCLVVNVWTPALDGSRPVLFWVHGGGFHVGSGYSAVSDGHELAMHEDVVVVSVNHRLGLLGFLGLEFIADGFTDSANAGMLDLVAALEWVRDNIASFGGDPDRVHVFGHSGGGSKVGTLMSMPRARALFRSAGIHGGPPFGLKDPERSGATAVEALDLLGLTPTTAAGIQSLSSERMIQLQAELGVSTVPSVHGMRFAPVVGPAVLPSYPQETFAAGDAAAIPLITGTSLDESRYAAFTNPVYQQAGWDIAPAELEERIAAGMDAPGAAAVLIDRYRALMPEVTNGQLLFDILSDQFRTRTIRIADAKVQGGGADTWLYLCDANRDGAFGSLHGTEMPFFFRTVGSSDVVPPTEHNLRLQEVVSHALAEFARSGIPQLGGGIAWQPYSVDGRETLVFGDDGAGVESDPVPGRRAAWEGVTTSVGSDPWARLFA